MKRPWEILWRIPKFAGFLVKKPAFGARIVEHHLRERLFKQPMIRAIEYSVTFRCQASCDKCSAVKMLDDSRPMLTHDEVRQLGDDCFALGNYEANFTGGEPLLSRELEDFITYFHPGSTFVGINTNGALLDRKRILSLYEAGADMLKISLDSPVPEEHDESRGIPGLYNRIVDALRITREIRGIRCHLCVVATREMIETGKVDRVLALAKDNDATMGIVLPSAVGRWSSKHEILIERQHRAALQRIARDHDVFFQGNVGKTEFVCPCGTREIYITCYGDVIPCPFIQIGFGNVREERFRDIYYRMNGWKTAQGPRPECSAAEDPEFRARFVDPIADEKLTPVNYRDHPAWKDGSGGAL